MSWSEVSRKTDIPNIEESDTPLLPEMYAKLLAGLDGIRDRATFLIACFCALRPDLGMLHQQCVHYREYRPAAAQANQAQEPLRRHELPPCRAKPCARRFTCGG
jgi:hypothetical protein